MPCRPRGPAGRTCHEPARRRQLGRKAPAGTVNRKAWALFAATSVIWGSSFLFIRVAVAHMPPSLVVFGRCLLGAAFLMPLAVRKGALAGLRRAILDDAGALRHFCGRLVGA